MFPAKNEIITAITENENSHTDHLKISVKTNIIKIEISKTPSLGPNFIYGYIIIRYHFFHYL
jgi:hypothetical protein